MVAPAVTIVNALRSSCPLSNAMKKTPSAAMATVPDAAPSILSKKLINQLLSLLSETRKPR